MAKRSAAEMEQKVQTLRQITGGKPFVIKELPNDILSRLDYANEHGFRALIERLSNGESQYGRQLIRVGWGQYDWADSSSGADLKPASPPHVAKDLTLDEKVALDTIQEIVVKSQDGSIRLTRNMLAMNPEEFLDLMEKLEAVKAVAKIGTNSHSTGGHVWGVVQDKFNDFYRVAQAVRSGQYEFSPEEPVLPSSELPMDTAQPPVGGSKINKVSTTERLSAELCKALAEEIARHDKTIKRLEDELAKAREARSDSVQRFNSFRQVLHKSQK